MDHKTLTQQELYKAIAYFVERQQLVAQAMRDLGLDLEEVAKWGTAAWFSGQGTHEPHLYEGASDEEQELYNIMMRARVRELPPTGFWGDKDEWEYFLHGNGCRLRNVNTGEPINWNCPNILAFDPYFFLHHLEWRIESRYREDELYHTRRWIEQHSDGLQSIITLIKEMIDVGLINQDFTLHD